MLDISNKTIISVDPGGTTGLALRFPYNGNWLTTTVVSSQELWKFLDDGLPDIIVYEEFNPRGARVDKYMLHTIRLVGGIQAFCYAKNITGYAHIPANRKYKQDESHALLIAKHGNRKGGFMIHEEDALAHLLVFEDEVKRGKWG